MDPTDVRLEGGGVTQDVTIKGTANSNDQFEAGVSSDSTTALKPIKSIITANSSRRDVNSIISPEADLRMRFRHVYAGKGGFLITTRTSSAVSSRYRPLRIPATKISLDFDLENSSCAQPSLINRGFSGHRSTTSTSATSSQRRPATSGRGRTTSATSKPLTSAAVRRSFNSKPRPNSDSAAQENGKENAQTSQIIKRRPQNILVLSPRLEENDIRILSAAEKASKSQFSSVIPEDDTASPPLNTPAGYQTKEDEQNSSSRTSQINSVNKSSAVCNVCADDTPVRCSLKDTTNQYQEEHISYGQSNAKRADDDTATGVQLKDSTADNVIQVSEDATVNHPGMVTRTNSDMKGQNISGAAQTHQPLDAKYISTFQEIKARSVNKVPQSYASRLRHSQHGVGNQHIPKSPRQPLPLRTANRSLGDVTPRRGTSGNNVNNSSGNQKPDEYTQGESPCHKIYPKSPLHSSQSKVGDHLAINDAQHDLIEDSDRILVTGASRHEDVRKISEMRASSRVARKEKSPRRITGRTPRMHVFSRMSYEAQCAIQDIQQQPSIRLAKQTHHHNLDSPRGNLVSLGLSDDNDDRVQNPAQISVENGHVGSDQEAWQRNVTNESISSNSSMAEVRNDPSHRIQPPPKLVNAQLPFSTQWNQGQLRKSKRDDIRNGGKTVPCDPSARIPFSKLQSTNETAIVVATEPNPDSNGIQTVPSVNGHIHQSCVNNKQSEIASSSHIARNYTWPCGKTKLPGITSDEEADMDNTQVTKNSPIVKDSYKNSTLQSRSEWLAQNRHQRLLGKMKKELTFEITPVGYDSRYETPRQETEEDIPEEVKLKAREKCQAWLDRYI